MGPLFWTYDPSSLPETAKRLGALSNASVRWLRTGVSCLNEVSRPQRLTCMDWVGRDT